MQEILVFSDFACPVAWVVSDYLDMDSKRLSRLIIVDTMLAHQGLHLPSAARELNVTVRTLWRDLDLLRAAGCEIECRVVSSRYLHFHLGERLFNPFCERVEEFFELDYHNA